MPQPAGEARALPGPGAPPCRPRDREDDRLHALSHGDQAPPAAADRRSNRLRLVEGVHGARVPAGGAGPMRTPLAAFGLSAAVLITGTTAFAQSVPRPHSEVGTPASHGPPAPPEHL